MYIFRGHQGASEQWREDENDKEMYLINVFNHFLK